MAHDLTRGSSLLVEFVGLPGVGKSHATRRLAARLADAGIPARSSALILHEELPASARILRKSAACAAEVMRRPGPSWRLVRTLVRTGQRRRLDVLRLAYNWLARVELVRRARSSPGVELFDEGPLQMLWSVGLQGREDTIRTWGPTLAETAPVGFVPDIVVVVRAPLDVIEARLSARGGRAARADRMDVAQREAALTRGADLLAEILTAAPSLVHGGSGPMLWSIRNADPEEFEADVDELARGLASQARSRARA